MIPYATPFFFFVQIVGLFFVTRYTLENVFKTLRIYIRHDHTVFTLIAFLYLPGTVLHELAHFAFAIACRLRVRSVSVIPSWDRHYIKLGSVVYEKKDVFRSVLVGIAPFFAGLAFFWFIGFFRIFPSTNLGLSILFGYLIFTVSSTMFSSKQDLVDIVYIIPFIVILVGIVYIFNIKITVSIQDNLLTGLLSFFQQVNIYLLFSLLINGVLIICMKGLQLVLSR